MERQAEVFPVYPVPGLTVTKSVSFWVSHNKGSVVPNLPVCHSSKSPLGIVCGNPDFKNAAKIRKR